MAVTSNSYWKKAYINNLQSRRLAQISSDAERLWWRILLACDDHGCLEADTFNLKNQCLSAIIIYDQSSWSDDRVEEALMELIEVHLVDIYEQDDNQYLEIPRYCELQSMGQGKKRRPSKVHDIIEGVKGVNRSDRIEKKKKEKKTPPLIPPKGGRSGEDSPKRIFGLLRPELMKMFGSGKAGENAYTLLSENGINSKTAHLIADKVSWRRIGAMEEPQCYQTLHAEISSILSEGEGR